MNTLALVAALVLSTDRDPLAHLYKATSVKLGGEEEQVDSPRISQTPPDQMTGVSFVQPDFANREGVGYYIYFARNKSKKGPIRAVFEIWSGSWLAADRVLIKADEALYDIPIPFFDWTRRVASREITSELSFHYCVERADIPLGQSHPKALAAMCHAKTLTVRFMGRHGQQTIDPNNVAFRDAVKQVCEAYGSPPPARPAPQKARRNQSESL